MSKASEGQRRQLVDIDFADDITLLSHRHDSMQSSVDQLSEVAVNTVVGLKIKQLLFVKKKKNKNWQSDCCQSSDSRFP